MTRSPRSGITPGSLLAEALSGVTSRPIRSTFTALGIAVGIAALVASVGLSQSAGAQIATRFHQAQASHLTATGAQGENPSIDIATVAALAERPGVTRTSRVTHHGNELIARARGPEGTPATVEIPVSLLGGDPGLLETIDGILATGRTFDEGHLSRHAPVAIIGTGVAQRLGIHTVAGQPVINVEGHKLLIIGILEDASFYTQALDSIIIPHTSAPDRYGEPHNTTVLLITEQGSTYSVAQDLPYLLQPLRPESLDIAAPPPAPDVADAISHDLDTLTLTLAGVGTIVAAISVTAIMTINVVERTPEIGLRRALGASRAAIAQQFLLESIVIGTTGGAAGAALGIGLIYAATDLRDWTPVLDAAVPYWAVGLGIVIGLLSGTYPAARASNISPTTSLRS